MRKFKRRKVICGKKFVTLEADLIDMKKISRQNGGIKYLLTVICCFSRYGFVRALKNKKTSTTIEALQSVLQCTKNKTKYISCDEGGEFISNKMKAFLQTKGITLYNSRNKTIKASIVERWNRTLQSRLYRYMYANETSKYIPVLQDIVDSYNATPHSAIKMAPKDVTNANSEQVWNTLYPYEERKKAKFNIGDLVRVPKKSTLFRKGYHQMWENTIYTIADILNTTPYTYKLLNENGNTIRKRYYERELNRVRYEK